MRGPQRGCGTRARALPSTLTPGVLSCCPMGSVLWPAAPSCTCPSLAPRPSPELSEACEARDREPWPTRAAPACATACHSPHNSPRGRASPLHPQGPGAARAQTLGQAAREGFLPLPPPWLFPAPQALTLGVGGGQGPSSSASPVGSTFRSAQQLPITHCPHVHRPGGLSHLVSGRGQCRCHILTAGLLLCSHPMAYSHVAPRSHEVPPLRRPLRGPLWSLSHRVP